MAEYRQTCPCKGRAISAVKDATRYDGEADDLRKEIAMLEREIGQLQEKARRARRRALDGEIGGCNLCGDRGSIAGNGSAQVGGSGRASTSLV